MPILNAFNKIFGDANERALKPYREVVPEINALEPEMQGLSDEELRAKTDEFRERLNEGETLDDMLPEAFAVVRETARRVIGMRHFDVQLIGGMVLHDGKIAEMRTGEGKTLVATLPAYLNALTGEGVHIVTVNDYLAKRDAGWMGRVYHALGLTVGCLQNQVSWVFDPLVEQPSEDGAEDGDGRDGVDADEPGQEREPFRMATKQQAYATDITFGTNHEFGFDYLRDNMVDDLSQKVQGKLKFAIVDEVDNILIDEARTPLIISGPARDSAQEYQRFAQLARRMEPEEDFTIDERHQAISLTEEGIDKVESFLRVDNLYDPENYSLTHFVENALRAEFLYLRDKQYVVREGEVIIVDEFTGRLMQGRRYSEGLHQAIEAKEGVKVQRESITYATITLQNYFRMYEKLSGMTGTAATEGEEFYKIYKLEVVIIPTNKPTARYDRGDYIYKTEAGKMSAVVGAVEEAHAQGRPVLIGTTSVERSEELSKLLDGRGIKHEVLNAKNHAREATIIAQAGRPGAVTVSTNMAGRGTDIILGGNPEQLGISDEEWQKEHDRVIEQGGLLVIGTARHESRRIDNQLRGRAGRQGDPGETRFFVSTEDDIVRRFGGERIRGVMNFAGIEDDYPMENKMVSRAIENAQSKVEGINFEIRKQLVDYDDVVNTQRDMIYRLRQRILAGEDIREEIMERVRKAVNSLVHGRLTGDPEDWDVNSFANEARTIFELPDEFEDPEAIIDHDPDEVEQILLSHADRLYDRYEEALGEDMVRKVMQAVFLRAIDSQWVEHLTAMENMRQGIGLQAVGQRDPLVQYKHQAFSMFHELVESVDTQIARSVFHLQIEGLRQAAEQQRAQDAQAASEASAEEPQPAGAQAASGSARGGGRSATGVLNRPSVMSNARAANQGGESTVAQGRKKIGRNEQCPCGSGKKYKRCHGRDA